MGGKATKYFKLSEDCTSQDAYTIIDNKTCNTFKVKKAGIRFTLLATHSGRMAHFGLLCNDNTFVTSDRTEFTNVMIHRVASNIAVVFSDTEDDIVKALRDVLGESASVVSRVIVGNITKAASIYAEIIRKEMSLDFKILIKNPAKETNCIAFCCRVLKILGLDVSTLPARLKKQLVADGWDEDFADEVCQGVGTLIKCFMVSYIHGIPNDIEIHQNALDVLNSLITEEEEQSMLQAFARYVI